MKSKRMDKTAENRTADTNPAFMWSNIQSFRVDLSKPNFCSTTKVL